MKNTCMVLLGLAGALCACASGADETITLETSAMRLVVGTNACTKSLVIKANGEECLDVREGLPLFSVTQDRPFNNEIKLTYPNCQTTYPANSVRREGDELVVGFEIAPYEARVKVRESKGHLLFELAGFVVKPRGYGSLKMTLPPVKSFRLVQLPVKNREHFGDWLNVIWDDAAATAVVGGGVMTVIGSEKRHGFRLLTADADRELELVGAKAAIVAAKADAFLGCMEDMEIACGLPNGVESRRRKEINQSIYWVSSVTPKDIDAHIALAKQGGFRLMLMYYTCFCGSYGYGGMGPYEIRPEYKNGIESVKEMLDKIKAAGITPGLHVLQTFIGFKSPYVTPVADHRLNLVRHFTLSRPLGTDNGDIYVEENPAACPTNEPSRILKFGGELIHYEGFTTKRPYRFTGIQRGDKATNVVPHPLGEIGGILDVCEYGAYSCYIDQNTSLQDEIAEKIARIYNAGFRFMYFDGSEGATAPYGIHVANAQYKVVSRMKEPSLFTEGAAKAHFDWHFLSGANAFDIFPPEKFKAMIVKWPQYEAPLMRQNFSRLNFGWWGLWLPGEKLRNGDITIGTQPDMWEFGTSRAAAWDCPATLQVSVQKYRNHPRIDDLMEVMRRWEDVRAKDWLTPAQKEELKSATQEHHLYINAKGEYELFPIEMLPTPDGTKFLRGFVFTREGRRVVAYWHTSGSGTVCMALGNDGAKLTLPADHIRYVETDLPVDAVRKAFQAAEMVKDGASGTVKIQMPPTCTNPDGMAVDSSGRLVIAAPNKDRRQPGAIFRLEKRGDVPQKWFDVPANPETGFSVPMGICFGPEGELYVCDCQDDRKGRLLRITFKDDRMASCETVACGLENANGVKYLNGYLYLTQAFQRKVERTDGNAQSALYMFAATDRDVRVANTPADMQCVFTDFTTNRVKRGGLNGVAVTKKGIVYTGNYGDGRVWKLTPGADGRFVKTELFAAGLPSADGLCVDAADNLYVADMLGCSAVRFTPAGKKTVLAKDCFTRPSEPCFWRGNLYVADFGGTTLTEVELAR